MRAGFGLLLWSLALPALAVPAQPHPVAAEAEVRALVERFRTAIVRGDGATLRALFLPQPQTWIAVAGEESLARRRVRDPAAPRLSFSTYAAFADSVEEAHGRHEEVFSNIEVRTDGAVAAVSFDFEYRVDGKPQNRGVEAWHLVKADDGWKIVSLVYSSHGRPP